MGSLQKNLYCFNVNPRRTHKIRLTVSLSLTANCKRIQQLVHELHHYHIGNVARSISLLDLANLKIYYHTKNPFIILVEFVSFPVLVHLVKSIFNTTVCNFFLNISNGKYSYSFHNNEKSMQPLLYA